MSMNHLLEYICCTISRWWRCTPTSRKKYQDFQGTWCSRIRVCMINHRSWVRAVCDLFDHVVIIYKFILSDKATHKPIHILKKKAKRKQSWSIHLLPEKPHIFFSTTSASFVDILCIYMIWNFLQLTNSRCMHFPRQRQALVTFKPAPILLSTFWCTQHSEFSIYSTVLMNISIYNHDLWCGNIHCK
jgi:hypothetical protein